MWCALADVLRHRKPLERIGESSRLPAPNRIRGLSSPSAILVGVQPGHSPLVVAWQSKNVQVETPLPPRIRMPFWGCEGDPATRPTRDSSPTPHGCGARWSQCMCSYLGALPRTTPWPPSRTEAMLPKEDTRKGVGCYVF